MTTRPRNPRQIAVGLIGALLSVLGLAVFVSTGPGLAGAQSSAVVQPTFDPPYVPSTDENGRPRQDSVAVECASATTLRLRFQPWNRLPGWLGVEDTTTGEWPVPQGEWQYGRTVELPNRAGYVFHYWSGASNEPGHPGAAEGHYTYRVIPGRCQPDTTTTAPPTTAPPEEPTTTTAPPEEPTTTTAPPETSTTLAPPTTVTVPTTEPTVGPPTTVVEPTTSTTAPPFRSVTGELTTQQTPSNRPGALAVTGRDWLIAVAITGALLVLAGYLATGGSARWLKAKPTRGPGLP